MNIEKSVFVVTGGAQGLGLEFAKMLSSMGGSVAILDMNPESLNKAVSSCMDNGSGEVIGLNCNVTDPVMVGAAFQEVENTLGPIAGLINNAGITQDAMLLKVDKETGKVVRTMSDVQWQSVIDVNLNGTFYCAREAAERMVNSGTKGVIINISSICRAGNVGQINYSATKAAVEAMAVTMSKELARFGIRANSIAPGYIGTEMVRAISPEMIAKIEAGIPAKRLGEPKEIAMTAKFIIENDYVSGRCFEVDGGLRI